MVSPLASTCSSVTSLQEECYRLILAKGGNHDLVDINGCTVAHILVVFTNIKMFDMAVECGAAMNIENKLGLTPLTVAAYLAKYQTLYLPSKVLNSIIVHMTKMRHCTYLPTYQPTNQSQILHT